MSDLSAEIRLAIRQSIDEQHAAFRKERRNQRTFQLGVAALILSLLGLGLYTTFHEWVKNAAEALHAEHVANLVIHDSTFRNRILPEIGKMSLGEKLDLSDPLVFDWDQERLARTGQPDFYNRVDKQLKWHNDEVISEENGFCFLTGVRGDFNGAGERVRVYLRESSPSREWWFEGNSHVTGVGATITCYKLK